MDIQGFIVQEIIDMLPDTDKCLVILSGGMDSTIAMRLAVEKYGNKNVSAITFDYKQKQAIEIDKAKLSTYRLGVKHKVVDAGFLGEISKGFSANVDRDMAMPTIKEVLGDPTPKTYVPNRNMILMSIAAAYAETQDTETILCGLQVHDEYGYWDTTQRFVDSMNEVFAQNRKIKPRLVAPFSQLSKLDELRILKALDDNVELLRFTLTCYDPDHEGRSCGVCPSCSERIANFAKFGQPDLIEYSKNIPWSNLIK